MMFLFSPIFVAGIGPVNKKVSVQFTFVQNPACLSRDKCRPILVYFIIFWA